MMNTLNITGLIHHSKPSNATSALSNATSALWSKDLEISTFFYLWSNAAPVLSNTTSAIANIEFKISNGSYVLFDATSELSSSTLSSIDLDISNTSYEPHNATTEVFNSTHVCYPAILRELQAYACPPLLVFGIITNVLTLLTLRSPALKQSPYVYLSALAAADLAALVFVFVDQLGDHYDLTYTVFRVRVYYPLANIAATVGVNIMMVLTIERFFFVQSPLLAPIKCTVSRARLHMINVLVFSFFVNLPRFFWYSVKECSGSVECKVGFQIFLNFDPHIRQVLAWTHSVIHNFIPFLVMIVLNPFLVYKVRQQQKNRRNLGVRPQVSIAVWSREQTRLTTVLTSIIFLFIVLVLPSAFADDPILEDIMGTPDHTLHKQIYQLVSNMLMWLNLSANFIMYTFMNSKFFNAFKEMLSAWKRCFLGRSIGGRSLARKAKFHVTLKKECSQTISLKRDSSLSGKCRPPGQKEKTGCLDWLTSFYDIHGAKKRSRQNPVDLDLIDRRLLLPSRN